MIYFLACHKLIEPEPPKQMHKINVIISPSHFRLDAKYPRVETIDWVDELYKKILTELITLPISVGEHGL